MNYGYNKFCSNWYESKKQELADKLREEVWPDIEIDELYIGVRLRRLPSEANKMNKIIDAADKVFLTVMPLT